MEIHPRFPRFSGGGAGGGLVGALPFAPELAQLPFAATDLAALGGDAHEARAAHALVALTIGALTIARAHHPAPVERRAGGGEERAAVEVEEVSASMNGGAAERRRSSSSMTWQARLARAAAGLAGWRPGRRAPLRP